MLRRAETIELEIHATQGAVSGTNNRAAGSVRVTAACLYTNHVLVPNLSKLLPDNPDLRIELVADGRDLSLIDREADVAIRLMRPDTASRAIVKHIGTMSYGIYAAASHATRALPWIAYDERLADLPQARWITEQAARDGAGTPQLLINDAETLLYCLHQGFGKSVLPVDVGDHQPGLVRLDDGAKKMSREVWLMVHPELRKLTRIRIVMNWLEEVARILV
jgi:DNA-binding transcriptional LysR family regulator